MLRVGIHHSVCVKEIRRKGATLITAHKGTLQPAQPSPAHGDHLAPRTATAPLQPAGNDRSTRLAGAASLQASLGIAGAPLGQLARCRSVIARCRSGSSSGHRWRPFNILDRPLSDHDLPRRGPSKSDLRRKRDGRPGDPLVQQRVQTARSYPRQLYRMWPIQRRKTRLVLVRGQMGGS